VYEALREGGVGDTRYGGSVRVGAGDGKWKELREGRGVACLAARRSPCSVGGASKSAHGGEL